MRQLLVVGADAGAQGFLRVVEFLSELRFDEGSIRGLGLN